MRSVQTVNELRNHVRRTFSKQPTSSVRMIGILFVRPTSSFALREIIPNLNYFHIRSGNHIDFYLAGYRDWNRDKQIPDDLRPFFVDTNFDAFRDLVEKSSTWKYSGGSDLILLNANHDAESNRVWLDLTRAIAVDLAEGISKQYIPSVETFFVTTQPR